MSTEYEITPFGAALVEAMPDRDRVRRVKRLFREGKCPASNCFTAEEIREFYGGKITPLEYGVKP